MGASVEKFRTALLNCRYSAEAGWPEIDRALRAEPGLVKEVDLDGWSALSLAAGPGGPQALPLLKRLLADGLSPDYAPLNGRGIPPLIAAARSANQEALALLLDYGADPGRGLDNGQTALHFPLKLISHNDRPEKIKIREQTLRILLQAGAGANPSDSLGNAPLHYAQGQIFIFRYFLDKARTAEQRFQRIRPPLKDKNGRPLPPESVRLLESGLKALAGLVELLLAYGADPGLRNSYGRTPAECAALGLGRDKDDSLWSWGAWNPPDLIDEASQAPADSEVARAEPADRGLAASLKLIPEAWLCPPAAEADLLRLNSALMGRLPEAMEELYRHHGGLKKEALGLLPRRLMSPEEVLQNIEKYSEQYHDDFKPFNDGRSTCLFWDSAYGFESAGMFLTGPLTGKIYLLDDEPDTPLPDFRDLNSFYRWLTSDLGNKEDGGSPNPPPPDYPSLDPANESPEDRILSEKLLAQWEEEGRRDERTAAYALRLSAYGHSRHLACVLLSIAADAAHHSTADEIADLIVRRNYTEAVELLYEAALEPESGPAAVKALMRLLALPEARKARNKLRELGEGRPWAR